MILLIFLWLSLLQSAGDQKKKYQKKNIFSPDILISTFHLKVSGYGNQSPAADQNLPRNHIGSEGNIQESQNKKPINQPDGLSQKSNRKRVGRAFFLNYSLIVTNSIKYWIKYSQWIEDWQFELNWEDQRRRWFSAEGYKFDSNPFLTNWTHILSGAIYYNFGRYNMLNSLESTLFMLGANLYWEYITEWREVISIGDNICSGIGGISIGEPLYWIGSYFTQKSGLLNKILGFIFNPVVGLNDLLDKNKVKSKLDILTLTKPDFALLFGPKIVSIARNDTNEEIFFNMGTEIRYYLIEGYGKPVLLNRYHKNPIYAELSADVTVGENAFEEYTLFTRAILFGRFKQKLVPDGDLHLRGYNLIFGAGTAFDFYQKKPVAYYDKGEYHYDFESGETAPQPTEFTDKMAILNLIGPVFELSLYSRDFRFRFSVSAYLDFAMVNSMAVNKYSEEHDLYNPKIKTTLSYYGYYYALGFTLSSDLVASYRSFELQGKFKYQSYDSIEGLDRFQEDLEDDPNLADTRLQVKLSLGYSMPKTPVTIMLTYERIIREGTLKETTEHLVENRIFTQLRISL